MAEIRADGPDALAYQPGVEDLFFRMETAIIQRTGPDFGGNLQLARSRNDLGHALARQALRLTILDLHSDLLALRQAVLDLAAAHTETIMPGYTHTQPAQPITFAHYLAGRVELSGQGHHSRGPGLRQHERIPLGRGGLHRHGL